MTDLVEARRNILSALNKWKTNCSNYEFADWIISKRHHIQLAFDCSEILESQLSRLYIEYYDEPKEISKEIN